MMALGAHRGTSAGPDLAEGRAKIGRIANTKSDLRIGAADVT
jgi:hypothetical protein